MNSVIDYNNFNTNTNIFEGDEHVRNSVKASSEEIAFKQFERDGKTQLIEGVRVFFGDLRTPEMSDGAEYSPRDFIRSKFLREFFFILSHVESKEGKSVDRVCFEMSKLRGSLEFFVFFDDETSSETYSIENAPFGFKDVLFFEVKMEHIVSMRGSTAA